MPNVPPKRDRLPHVRPATFAVAMLATAAAGACHGSTQDASTSGRLKPTYDRATGRLSQLAYDSNGDGTLDTWGFMDGTRVIRVESDEDQDGAIDRWEFHQVASEAGRPADNPIETLEKIETSTRHDGRVSRWEFFDRGILTRVEEDTTGDGHVDKWETYVSGALATMSLDTKGRGNPDRRFIYGPDGSLDRMELDPDGSGKFQPLLP